MAAAWLKRVAPADLPPRPEDYVRSNGIRLVKPYYFDFVANVKRRWIGQTVLDVFTQEFPARPRSYYEAALADGRLRVEGYDGPPIAPLKNGQRIRHFIHRHEPPVLDLPVQVLAQTPDLIAVSKPASMPVHASGQYRFNTVVGLLQAYNPDLGPLLPVHRLDKPVSGLLLFARSSQSANTLRTKIEERSVEKVYIARVMGAFPQTPIEVDAPLAWDPRANHARVVLADKASGQASARPDWEKEAKESLTEFQLKAVAPDGKTSLVECRPRTGRTHQIRVHLQHLGHPVANDKQYGGKYPGPRSMLGGMGQDAPQSEHMRSVNTLAGAHSAANHDYCNGSIGGAAEADSSELPRKKPSGLEYPVDADQVDELCMHCPHMAPINYPVELRPLWLHALCYSCQDWSFECPPPAWAHTDWTPTF
ncbi:hypothetical protein WJX72_004212 [[Myrmecia] bisecta]|uniref:Pseudouridine synthase n=1 Tax=[Myrmecia] bisecta TaxID=41462 RepID=A0AAW1R661_9CHLO